MYDEPNITAKLIERQGFAWFGGHKRVDYEGKAKVGGTRPACRPC